jgi:hypothetical protein
MPRNRLKFRTTTLVLAVFLVVEVALVVLLRTLGWLGTGSALQFVTCVFVSVLPLLIAVAMLTANRLRFGVRSLIVATTLVGVFLSVSLLPLLDFRSARQASIQLVSANAKLNDVFDWNEFYSGIELPGVPMVPNSATNYIPPWLTPFTKNISAIPADDAVHSIWLGSDAQIAIFAKNWQRFSSLQSVGVGSGVSVSGLERLRNTLPRFEHLDCVHTNDVYAPKNWYRSLTNVRTLWVWGEGSSRGNPFPTDHLIDIASLPNLEVFMVLGYAFDDSNARIVSGSRSIKRVILRGTAVTQAGELSLAEETSDRIFYRN